MVKDIRSYYEGLESTEARREEGGRLRQPSALRVFPSVRFLTLVAIKLSWWYVEKRRTGSRVSYILLHF